MYKHKISVSFCIYYKKISKASFVIGMAGSGKTTFVKVFSEQDPNVFTINIDPAVLNIPY